MLFVFLFLDRRGRQCTLFYCFLEFQIFSSNIVSGARYLFLLDSGSQGINFIRFRVLWDPLALYFGSWGV